MRRVSLITLGFTVGCALALPAAAQDSFDLLGIDSRSAAMGGAMTAEADGFASVYHQPANLSFCRGSSVSARASYLMYGLKVDVGPDDIEPEQLDNRLGMTLGGCLKLPHNLAIGLSVDTGATNLLGLQVSTPNAKPIWLMYGPALLKPTIQFAASYRILDNLSVGLGVSATLNVGMGLSAGVPLFEDGTVQVGIDTQATPAVGLLAGVAYRPGPVKLGLTYRGAHYVQLKATMPINLDGGSDLAIIDMRLANGYVPHQVALGVSVDPIPALTLAADVTWHHWSGYTGKAGGFGPYVQVVPGASDALPDEANGADLLDYAVASLVFSDTIAPRVGLEYRFKELLAFRAGYHYRMSPYRNPTGGTTNLMDANVHTPSLGLGLDHLVGKKGMPKEDRKHRMSLDLSGRMGLLEGLAVSQPAQDQYAAFSFAGGVYDIGLTGTYAWR